MLATNQRHEWDRVVAERIFPGERQPVFGEALGVGESTGETGRRERPEAGTTHGINGRPRFVERADLPEMRKTPGAAAGKDQRYRVARQEARHPRNVVICAPADVVMSVRLARCQPVACA